MRKLIAAMVGVAAIAAPLTMAATSQASTPVCQIVSIAENSGNGPNYPVKVCNSGGPALTRLPAGHHWVFIIDGGPLPERNQRTATIAIAEVK